MSLRKWISCHALTIATVFGGFSLIIPVVLTFSHNIITRDIAEDIRVLSQNLATIAGFIVVVKTLFNEYSKRREERYRR